MNRNEAIKLSKPNLCNFIPDAVPFQKKVVEDIRCNFKYDSGVHELLLSGSIGSAKTELAAHLAVTHCMMYSEARVLLGRRAMPHLKQTIWSKVINHCRKDLKLGTDYSYNKTTGEINFRNDSSMLCLSWADKDYEKFRSYDFSAGIIEELTENDDEEAKAMHTEMIGRIGRINAHNSGVKENWVIYNTNPGDPTHWGYTYFIKGQAKDKLRHVYYSLTRDNPFLPDWYESSLRHKYDKKQIERLLEGKWIFISSDVIYYEYSSSVHYILSNTCMDKRYPVRISFDFNIGRGKPFSVIIMQYIEDTEKFRAIDEVVIEGTRTYDALEEIAGRGYFDLKHNPDIIIHGDATGRHKDTRNNQSDYDIIEEYLMKYKRKKDKKCCSLNYDIDVPLSNPSVRDRHNLVNGQLKNAEDKVHTEIDERCETLDEGLSKCKLVENGRYIEDDSKPYQHITTAWGYAVCRILEGISETEPAKAYS